MESTYYRWTQRNLPDNNAIVLEADILGTETIITAVPSTGRVAVAVPDRPLSPDEARMIGVRLIEAAALADNGRSVRGSAKPEPTPIPRRLKDRDGDTWVLDPLPQPYVPGGETYSLLGSHDVTLQNWSRASIQAAYGPIAVITSIHD